MKKAAHPICIAHYKLDPKFYDRDYELREDAGDPRVSNAVEAALEDDAYLAGPPDRNVSLLVHSGFQALRSCAGTRGQLNPSCYGGTDHDLLLC